MRTPDYILYIQDQMTNPMHRMVTGHSRTTPLWSSLGLRYIDHDSIRDVNHELHPHTHLAVGGVSEAVQVQVR